MRVQHNSSDDPTPSEVELPAYAVRCFVYASMVITCGLAPIDHNLIQYMDAEKVRLERFEDVLPAPQTPYDRYREDLLSALLVRVMQGGFLDEYDAVADDNDIQEGYRAIKHFLQGQS